MKRRILTFEQIADSRFNQNEDTLNHLVERIFHDLFPLSGKIIIKATGVYKYEFGLPEPCTSWRVKFYIYKNKRITWNKIMEIINNINAPVYKFV